MAKRPASDPSIVRSSKRISSPLFQEIDGGGDGSDRGSSERFSSPSLREEIEDGVQSLLDKYGLECFMAALKNMKKKKKAKPGADERGNTPSDLVTYNVWKDYQGATAAEAEFLCFRPQFAETPLPMTLVCAKFQLESTDARVEKQDMYFAEAFFNKVHDPEYVTDHKNQVVSIIRDLINTYIDADVVPYYPLQGQVQADGVLVERRSIRLVFEFKAESGDPDFQVLEYFKRTNLLMKSANEMRQYALAICVLGPRLEVWGVTMESGKVWAEPLSETKCYGPERYLIATARIWRAIRLFVEGYQPVPLVSPPVPWPMSNEIHVERLFEDKLVFKYVNKSGETEVAKFASKYCSEAHKAWMPFAPAMKGPVENVSTFQLVRMEYLSRDQGWVPAEELVEGIRAVEGHVAKLKRCIAVALDAGHSEGYVHGDLRLCNILLRRSDQVEEDGYPGYQVRIHDFDWAGKMGEVVYPRMNRSIDWPAGAEYGANICKDHDVYFSCHLVEQLRV